MMLTEGLLQLVFVHLGVAEGLAPEAMRQHQFGSLAHVGLRYLLPAPIGRQGLGHLSM